MGSESVPRLRMGLYSHCMSPLTHHNLILLLVEHASNTRSVPSTLVQPRWTLRSVQSFRQVIAGFLGTAAGAATQHGYRGSNHMSLAWKKIQIQTSAGDLKRLREKDGNKFKHSLGHIVSGQPGAHSKTPLKHTHRVLPGLPRLMHLLVLIRDVS